LPSELQKNATPMIRLPPHVTFEKKALPDGGWSYDFRHAALGALGRILLQGLPSGNATHISCEVAGDPNDPMTAQRRAIFEPLGLEISSQMEKIKGSYTGATPIIPPPRPVKPTEVVESKLMQCQKCDAFVAMLVFAPHATDTGRFEDYARLMYQEYSRHNLSAWIIGPSFGPGPDDPANILQVWPTRKPLQCLTPGQFNPLIEQLASNHCRQ
jgi:hypothetical protein